MGTIALGWGLLTAPQSTSLVGIAACVAGLVSAVAAVLAVRVTCRGLYLRTVAGPMALDGTNQYETIIRFTLRGGTGIKAGDFAETADRPMPAAGPAPTAPAGPETRRSPMEFAVGPDIIEARLCRMEPPGVEPLVGVKEGRLTLGPSQINTRTRVDVAVVTGLPPAGPVRCTREAAADVRIYSVEDVRKKLRAYLAALLGGVSILALLAARLAAPALAATVRFQAVCLVLLVCLACLVTAAVIGAATLRKARSAVSLSTAVLLGLVGSVTWLAVTPATATPPPPLHVATCRSTGAANWISSFQAGRNDLETVGFSSSKPVFVNRPFPDEQQAQRTQDERVKRDEQLIFAENALVDCTYLHDEQAGGQRQLVELAYFAGLTEGVDEDYDSGAAEELEGLLAAQRVALHGNGPLLKVVVANGGAKMRDALPVARRLIALAHSDRFLLGVVGMDRSTSVVQAAIRLFAHSQVPVVATTLSADGIGHGARPYYYELSPDNRAEAALIRRYVQQVVPAYFAQASYRSGDHTAATRVVIEEPGRSPRDRYTFTLVRDLTSQAWGSVPRPEVIYTPTSALCGNSQVDIYAGRHDKPVGKGIPYDNDFSGFLSYIGNSCPAGQRPFIIADDGVTRFVADPQARADSVAYGLKISYVSKGIAILRTGSACLRERSAARYRGSFGAFCHIYAGIATALRAEVRGLRFLWTGERTGLAYDAANLFLTAAGRAGPLSRAQIPGRFKLDGEVKGVIGAVNFARSNIAVNSPRGMPLTIVRLNLKTATSAPTCAFPGQPGYLYGPGPGHGPCPNDHRSAPARLAAPAS